MRQSKYLEVNSGKLVIDTHGDPLTDELANVLGKNSEYRKLYFKHALKTKLQKIRYEDFQIIDTETMEDITPFQSESEYESNDSHGRMA